MSVTAISQTNFPLASEHRIPRKSVPSPASIRYPEPDPDDPFAPLALLRSRGLNSSRLSIQGDYLDNTSTHAPLGSPLSRECFVTTASFQPINIAKKRSSARIRPFSQDVGYMLKQTFPSMEQKCHYRRRAQSIDVPAETTSPYTFHNLQTYILPIAQSPDEDYEAPTLSSMFDNSSTTAISSCDWVPRSISRGRLSSASFTKFCGIVPPQSRRTTISAAPFPSQLTSASNDLPGRDSSSQHDSASHDSTTVATLQVSASTHELPQPNPEFFAFPRYSQVSLAQYAPLPRSRTLSVDTTFPIPIQPDSSGQYVRNRHSCSFTTDLPPRQTPAKFDENGIPTMMQLSDAASVVVIAENGLRVPFGDLWMKQQTIVCFIRHFWCPLCQDYMFSISTNADPILLGKAGINLIIISNGSYKMIKFYRQIFNCPFAMYTDPTLKLYAAMGMTLRTRNEEQDSQCGDYVRHGHMSGVAMVLRNALRVGIPVWEKGGDVSQLGGEFVLGPGMQCTFAHRMRTKRGHLPITRVLTAAGLEPTTPVKQVSPLEPFDLALDEEIRKQYITLKKRRQARKGGDMWCITSCGLESANESGGEEGYYEEYTTRGRPLSKSEQIRCMA